LSHGICIENPGRVSILFASPSSSLFVEAEQRRVTAGPILVMRRLANGKGGALE
jgi:hypothetical protein